MVMNRIKETISMLKGLDQATLEGIRYTLFFIIILDMGLFYWWMKWKSFALALMVVCLIILSVILLLERKFPPEEVKEEPKDKKGDDKPNKPGLNLDIDLSVPGLPNSEDYNKRLEEAIGTGV